MGSSTDMMAHYKASSISVHKAKEMQAEELKGKLVVGELLDIEKPEFIDEMQKLVKRVQESV